MVSVSAAASPFSVTVVPTIAELYAALADASSARAAAAAAAGGAPRRVFIVPRAIFGPPEIVESRLGNADRADLFQPGWEYAMLAGRDTELLAETLADHLDRLYRAASAMSGSREDAEDLVQETYARVLADRRTIGAADQALFYLLGVLRNTHISTLRTRLGVRRPPRSRTASAAFGAASDSPAAAFKARELFAAIYELPNDYRDAVITVDVAGLSYAEAAKVLSCRPARS